MKTKNIKVAYKTRYTSQNCQTVPMLQMEGRWLEQLGFTIDTTVAVEYGDGAIRIRLLTAEEQAEQNRRAAEDQISRKRFEIEKLQKALAQEYENLPKVAEPAGTYGTSR